MEVKIRSTYLDWRGRKWELGKIDDEDWDGGVRCGFAVFQGNENNRKHIRSRHSRRENKLRELRNAPHSPLINPGLLYIIQKH